MQNYSYYTYCQTVRPMPEVLLSDCMIHVPEPSATMSTLLITMSTLLIRTALRADSHRAVQIRQTVHCALSTVHTDSMRVRSYHRGADWKTARRYCLECKLRARCEDRCELSRVTDTHTLQKCHSFDNINTLPPRHLGTRRTD